MQSGLRKPFTLIICLILAVGFADIGVNLVETHAANGQDRRRDQFPETASRRH